MVCYTFNLIKHRNRRESNYEAYTCLFNAHRKRNMKNPYKQKLLSVKAHTCREISLNSLL